MSSVPESSVAAGRVLVGVSGSLANSSALHAAVAQARQLRAELVAVRAWLPVGGEIAYRRGPCPPLMALWRQQAYDVLLHAFEESMGGLPADLSVRCFISRGETGPVLISLADRPGDLLVIGTGRRSGLASLRRRTVSRYCIAHAGCPVLAVPEPALLGEFRRGRRHSHPRMRSDYSKSSDNGC